MKKIFNFLLDRKYEFLLFGLLQHTFIGIFLTDLDQYRKVIWPINMVILILCCLLVFLKKGKRKNVPLILLTLSVCVLPVIAAFTGFSPWFMEFLSILYVLFFAYVFYDLLGFLIRPSYINTDIISASICGYLLLVEIMTFLMQTCYYNNPTSFKGIDNTITSGIYIDFVYYSTITLTSIGYGDILPASPQMKLLSAFFGIVGQFYSVVLVGILISKFTSRTEK